MEQLASDLPRRIQGEVHFDRYFTLLYSTDASIYAIEPVGVVLPKDREDIRTAVAVAAERAIPILPRGAGTSLAGQAVGEALILDMSKYLNRILEVNPEEGWARVEPGVVLDELNAALRPHTLLFGPDVATSSRATIGGMIGNNSAGARSILYGKTVDHLLELRVLLSSGEELALGPRSPKELERLCQESGTEARITKAIQGIVEANRVEILNRYPQILRRVSGYNLDELVKESPWNLARLMAGSEGTLGVVLEAKVRLVPRPKRTALAVLHFGDILAACEAAAELLPLGPAAIELLDRHILDLTKGTLEYARRMTFVDGDPAAVLLAELYGESEAEIRAKEADFKSLVDARRLGYGCRWATSLEEQQSVWQIRKAGLGLLLGMRGEKRPVAFVEDTAVAPEQLGRYLREFDQIVARHGTESAIYGHASVGCLHLRPILNLREGPEVEKMRAIAEEVSDLVLQYGGAMSGEHGDGLARSQWIPKFFGPRLYEAFREVKWAFDPNNLMNPGKIVDAPALTENLRYGPGYRMLEVPTIQSFRREGGFAGGVELCTGIGACRKRLEGTMCPSYMATGDEEHTTRGRANALRLVLSGQLPPEELTGKRLFETLDLCLQCKGCKGECPSNVDMAKLKAEVLAKYYERHGVPLQARFFAHLHTLVRWESLLAPFSNWADALPGARWLLHHLLGIDRRRPLPTFVRPTFHQWYWRRRGSPPGNRGQILLLADTFMTYHYPEVGKAATELLERLGYQVLLAEITCCGRPMISKGLLRQAQGLARTNVRQLYPAIQKGIPLVGCEPSCLLTLRDEYRDLVDTSEADAVAEESYLLEEFLLKRHPRGDLSRHFRETPKRLLLHGHCHQKALVGTKPLLELLGMIPELEVQEVNAGCCGMAGSFGFEREHYELSMAIGRLRLFPAIEAAGAEVEVVAPGVSCRQQISHGTGRPVRHPAEILCEALQSRS
ncbi:MAG: FAD-binding and (Fe-S)-binding domain-containing protein [Candidatus Methylomirabilales bacterium]